eukprot:1572715-Amphidinium_carterae.2
MVGDVKTYLTFHNVHVAKSVETIDIRNTQDAYNIRTYMEEDTQFRDNRYPIVPTNDEADELEDYNESRCQSGRREMRYYQFHKLSTRIRTTLNDKTHHARNQWL